MDTPTLADAQQASVMVDLCNTNLNALAIQLAAAQTALAAAQAYDPAAAIAAAQASINAAQAASALVTAQLTGATAIIAVYNTANPGAPIAVG